MAKKSFETELARLEQINRELEDGDLTLEKSIKKFDEGMKAASFCDQQLKDAQAKIEILLKKDDAIETVPYNDIPSED